MIGLNVPCFTKALQRQYAHLRDIPLHSFKNGQPLLLIGSDNSHLITAVKTVHVDTQVGPAAVHTKLGRALQGPEGLQNRATYTHRSYFIGAEMNRLIQAGYVKEITAKEANESEESWYLPHYLVYHNGKACLVFNCSFVYKGISLNEQLLPGPNLGPSLIGVQNGYSQSHAGTVWRYVDSLNNPDDAFT